MQVHEPAGGVVDVDQERAGGRPILEPAVVAAIDLDQFAHTRAPVAWLVNRRWTVLAGYPQASFSHELAHRFLGQRDAVPLKQLLASQRRPKVRIAIVDDCQRDLGHAVIKLPMPGLATLPRDQPRRTFNAITLY